MLSKGGCNVSVSRNRLSCVFFHIRPQKRPCGLSAKLYCPLLVKHCLWSLRFSVISRCQNFCFWFCVFMSTTLHVTFHIPAYFSCVIQGALLELVGPNLILSVCRRLKYNFGLSYLHLHLCLDCHIKCSFSLSCRGVASKLKNQTRETFVFVAFTGDQVP